MDITDLFWLNYQDKAISELRESHKKTAGTAAVRIGDLEKENFELRLRLSLLIRLLIERGVFTADDYSKLLEDTKEALAASKPSRRKK